MLSLTSHGRETRTPGRLGGMHGTYLLLRLPSPAGQDRVRRARPALPSTTTAALLLDTKVVEIISLVFALCCGWLGRYLG